MSGSGKKPRPTIAQLQAALDAANHALAQQPQQAAAAAPAAGPLASQHHQPPAEREDTPPKRARLSAAAALTQREQGMQPGGGIGRAVATTQQVEHLYSTTFSGHGAEMGARMSAELRRILTLMWGIALLYHEEKAQEPNHRSEATELAMAAMTEMVRLLLRYEHSPGGQEALASKLAIFESGTADFLGSFVPAIADKARMWLAVPSAGQQRGRYTGGGSAAAGGAYPRAQRPTMAQEMTTALTAMFGNANAGVAAQQQAATQQQQAQMAFSNMHAQQQMQQAAAQQLQMQHVLQLPNANQQFAPQVGGMPQREDNRGVCFWCQNKNVAPGHNMHTCPHRVAGKPQLLRGTLTPYVPLVSARATPHTHVHTPSVPASAAAAASTHPTPLLSVWPWPTVPMLLSNPSPTVAAAHEGPHAYDAQLLTESRAADAMMLPADVSNESKDEGTSSSKMQGGVRIEEECACGRCGCCTDGIDLLQKEQRTKLSVAKDPRAVQIEISHSAISALLASAQPE